MSTKENAMELAQALVSATKALERAQRRVDEVVPHLQQLKRPNWEANVLACREASVAIATINRQIRLMNA